VVLCPNECVTLSILCTLEDRDHQQTKKLLQRGQNSVSTLVSRFNRLVDEMIEMKKKGGALPRARMPAKLELRMLYRLHVDDAMWNEDGLMEEPNESPPAWLADLDTRDAIIAMLEKDRVMEEQERLDAEEQNLMKWLRYEVMDVQSALAASSGVPACP
jgi:hypothetical protein